MIVLSPTDATSQEAVLGSAQSVVVERARAPSDTAPYSIVSSTSALSIWVFELKGSAQSIVQFKGVLPEAAPCVVYAPVDLDGQIDIVVDVPTEVYELVRLVVHLDRCLYAEYGGGLRHPLRA